MTVRALLAIFGVMILCGLLLLLLAPDSDRLESRAQTAAPSAIRVAIQADIRGTNPGVTRDLNTDTVINHVVESLVAYDEDLRVAPLLAETVEPSADFRTYRFRLRDALRFHNGAPVTSAEVKWSWKRMLNPATGFRCDLWYDGTDRAVGVRIVGIDTPDPRTIIFRLDRPSTAFLDQMASPQCITAILHPSSVGADGDWLEPVGTGPYVITEWRRGEYVDLRRFPDYVSRKEPIDGYAGGRPALTERIRFVVAPELSVGVSALKGGDLDILPRVPPYLTSHAKLGRAIKASSADQLIWHTLLIQTRDPLLSDVRIRRAIAKAINLDQLAVVATYSNSAANPSAVPRVSRFHLKRHDLWWPYDPAGARILLAQAGYRGQPIRIQTNRKTPFAFDNAVGIQAMLVAAGIDARLEVLDWATQLTNYREGSFQLSSFSYSGKANPVLNYASFVGSKVLNPSVQWDSVGAQRLLRAATMARSEADQQKIFDRLHALMMRDVPIIGLYNEPGTDLHRAEIQGYRNWPLGSPRLWGVRRRGS